MRKSKITDTQIKEIISLYEQGLGTAQIGQQYKVTRQLIGNLLKKNNVKIRMQGKKITKALTFQQSIEIRQFFATMEQEELAALYKVHRSTICNILNNKIYKILPYTDNEIKTGIRIYLPME